MSSASVRAPLIARMGESAFRGFYSVLVAIALVWMVDSYRFAAVLPVWDVGPLGPPILYFLMFVASILFVCSLTTRNPTLAGMDGAPPDPATLSGIYAVTRHPMLSAFAFWSAGHVIVRGDAAGILFFGGFFVLSALGMAHIDARRRASGGPEWATFEAATSRMPFRAAAEGRTKISLSAVGWGRIAAGILLFAALIFAHGPVVGLYLTPI
jgi:uncharacterized membrane protein